MQHPYLIDRNFEPTGLSELEAHKRLIETSTKLVLLKTLLAKLKEKGHRVLLFSQVGIALLCSRATRLIDRQFVIALDIIEDFVVGEGYKFLRLVCYSRRSSIVALTFVAKDGNSKQAERQRDMDKFNKPGSDYFLYLLSTRAGGKLPPLAFWVHI